MVYALVRYDIPPLLHAAPTQPLCHWHLLLPHAPHHSIDAYALASHSGLEEPAVVTSEHLLVYDASRASDELVAKTVPGPTHFCRPLCMHHQNWLSALKSIALQPPAGQHPPTPVCGEGAPTRARVGEAWAFAVAG